MGEYEIITSLAKKYISQGDSIQDAIKDAIKTFEIALKEALEYEYKELAKDNEKEKIFSANKGIVFQVANTNYSYFRKSSHFDDLVQEGFIALWRAIDSFDNSKGASFSSYAFKQVWGTMGIYVERKIKCKKRYTDSKFNEIKVIGLSELTINKVNNDEKIEISDVLENERFSFIEVENKIAIEQILEYAKKLNEIEGYERIQEMLLLYLKGLSYRKISEEIGKSENIAGARIRNFLSRYKNLIESEMAC